MRAQNPNAAAEAAAIMADTNLPPLLNNLASLQMQLATSQGELVSGNAIVTFATAAISALESQVATAQAAVQSEIQSVLTSFSSLPQAGNKYRKPRTD